MDPTLNSPKLCHITFKKKTKRKLKERNKYYLGQMGLQPGLGFHVLHDAVSECLVHGVPLVHHGGSTSVQCALNLVTHCVGAGTLALGALDVVIAELSPGLRYRSTVDRRTNERLKMIEIYTYILGLYILLLIKFYFFIQKISSPFIRASF